jgi:hypothetical protein
MKPLLDLGLCTLGDCTNAAKWVHGSSLSDGSGQEMFPWRLCDCCQESVLAADALLHGDVANTSGIVDPDEADWCFEACKVAVDQMKKLEAMKK